MNVIKHNLKIGTQNFLYFLRWFLISCITGMIIGPVGALFVRALGLVNGLRGAHPQIMLGLPLAGIAIVFLYKITNFENDKGTNLVITSSRGEDEVPFRMAPLIFISTILTHFFGGSAGREGAALQLGGSIGNQLGRLFRFSKDDRRMMVMCGMSAAFSAIFGTPLAATIFTLEVGCVGLMQYSALVPCMIASLVASSISKLLGAHAEAFTITEPVSFALIPALKIVVLGILCALVGLLFYNLLHKSGHLFKKWIPNAYLRILAGSFVILGLTWLLKTTAYSGAGVNLIEEAFEGHAPTFSFLLKMLFTLITLGVGFKGGEIVPSFTIGATFGCLFGTLFGLSPSLCAAVGMVSVFCAVTNCPLASLLIGFEMFGFDSMPFLFIGVTISYLLSGYDGLYSQQQFKTSRYHFGDATEIEHKQH